MNTEISRHVGFINSRISTVHRPQAHLFAEVLIGHAIVLYHRNTIPEISYQFFRQSKIIEIVKVHYAIVSLFSILFAKLPNEYLDRIVQIHDIAFDARHSSIKRYA